MGNLTKTYLARVEANEDLKPATKEERCHAVKRFRKTRPDFDKNDPRTITLTMVIDWTNRLKRDGTGFRSDGAKTVIKGNSPTAVNKSVDALRRILDIAVAEGLALVTNVVREKPPEGRLKKRETKKPKNQSGWPRKPRQFEHGKKPSLC